MGQVAAVGSSEFTCRACLGPTPSRTETPQGKEGGRVTLWGLDH